MEALKELFKSKKFLNYAAAAVTTLGVALLVQYAAFDEALATSLMDHLMMLALGYLGAQGAADVAKAIGKPAGVGHKEDDPKDK